MSENIVESMIGARSLPLNFGPLRGANANARVTGPCGDTMEVWLLVDDGRVSYATFTTDGCASSLLCGSAAAAMVNGLPLAEAAQLTQDEVLAVAGDIAEEERHCALLAENTIRAALDDYRAKHPVEEDCDRESCSGCANDSCSSRKAEPSAAQPGDDAQLERRMRRIANKIVVLSGKGGVGKSTVSVNLAVSLALAGKRVGLLDVDIHGPSIPTMLGLSGQSVDSDHEGILPAELHALNGLRVISIGLLMEKTDMPLIWRGPMKTGAIKQFLADVQWGDLDYLIVDCPPGTGDEPLSVIQMLGNPDGAVVVTTPQEVAAVDVSKSINFCRQLQLPVFGIVENMSGFVCPHCGTVTDIFQSGAGERLAARYGVPFLGAVPIDASVSHAGDAGTPMVKQHAASRTAEVFRSVSEALMDRAIR